MTIQALRQQIPAVQDRVYLNTGTSGPIPSAAIDAQMDLLKRFSTEGFSTPAVAQHYVKAIKEARLALEKLLNADMGTVALTQSTSDGIGIVTSGMTWEAGDEIIISDLEHISGIAPWVDLARRFGVKVTWVSSENGVLTADQVTRAISDKTRLICISHISWATGAVLPIKEICQAAGDRGVLTLIDGAQSAGQLPIDVNEIGCDFYSLPGQKWLLGPEGTGALYVKKTALEHVAPTRLGWPSLANTDVTENTPALEYHPDARRYEAGTIHAPAFSGLTKSMELLEAIGWERVFEHAVNLAEKAREKLSEIEGVRILSPEHVPSGLITFAVDGHDPDKLVASLWEKDQIIVRSIPGSGLKINENVGALRGSFHIFNTEEDVHKLVRAIAERASTP